MTEVEHWSSAVALEPHASAAAERATSAGGVEWHCWWLWDELGSLSVWRGDLGASEVRYQQALSVIGVLAAADPRNAEWQRDLSISHDNLGNVRTSQGDLDGALAAYEACLKISERLAAADPRNAQWQRDLFVSYWKVGDLQITQGRKEGAREFARKALDIAERLAGLDPSNAVWRRDLEAARGLVERVG